VAIAVKASEGKVCFGGSPTMLYANDVVDLAPMVEIVLVYEAILADSIRALGDANPK
jgi:hypothetical protein